MKGTDLESAHTATKIQNIVNELTLFTKIKRVLRSRADSGTAKKVIDILRGGNGKPTEDRRHEYAVSH